MGEKSAPKGPPSLAQPTPLITSCPSLPRYLNGQLGGGCGWPGEAQDGGFGGEAHWHTGPAPLGSAVPHPQCPRAPRLMENGTWAMEMEEERGKHIR